VVIILKNKKKGLTAIKSLIENNHKVVCFEKSSDIGGNWNYISNGTTSTMYENIEIFTSKENMCYSDFPHQTEKPFYLNLSDVLQYLENYANNFELKKYIKFKTKVMDITKEKDNKWKVKILNSEGEVEEIVFDSVLVCNGHHNKVTSKLTKAKIPTL
jgi:dimethylaniline monooxygenase (N-oxide forming)